LFGLSYIPTDRKRQLRKLQDRLANAGNPKTRNETNLLIQEIMSEAKPYLSCDKFELQELKNQLLENITALSTIGKAQSVESFQMYLKEVDFRLQTLLMEETLKEKDRLRPDEAPNLKERSISQNQLEKQRIKKKQEARGHTRWVIGMDDEDDNPSE